MLVPVLVFGVMGCGKVQEGDANPVSLQGYWSDGTVENPDLVIVGNQITLIPQADSYVGNIALRTSYSGAKGDGENGIVTNTDGDFTVEFFWFDKPYTKIGQIKAQFDNATATSFTVSEVKYETYYQNVVLPNIGAKYTKQ